MKEKIIIVFLFIGITSFYSCNKKEFLDAKPNQSLVVPHDLEDFQAILDMDGIMNGTVNGHGVVPQLGDIGADDYYILEDQYSNTLTDNFRRYHIWDTDVNIHPAYDWQYPYTCIFYSNVVIDGLENMTKGTYDIEKWNKILGAALFYRAHSFHQLAQVYAHPYGDDQMNKYGIPLRLSSDIAEIIERSTVEKTYEQIVKDLKKAVSLLPDNTVIKEQPSKRSAYALLARVYLSMRQYTEALSVADSCLKFGDELLDYNNINSTANYPFLNTNIMDIEVIFKSTFVSHPGATSPVNTFVAKIDETLISSYHEDDLRLNIFYREATPSGYRYKGSFYGSNNYFAGIALDEIYLIKIECLARNGNITEAVDLLEYFRRKRFLYSSDNYKVPLEARKDNKSLISFIKEERRRQLPFRGLRWTDLRRYNLEGDNIILERNISGEEYVLLPNDRRYTFLIPDLVIGYNPTMEQNPR